MYKIMIADDEGIAIEGLKFIIEKNFKDKCIIESAKSGREVIELSETFRPDIVFMDIRMPEMDGIEATFRLRDKGVKTPIIAVTAFAFDQDRNRILEAGCDDYISKPIFSAILKERIRYWLNEKRKL